MKFDSGVDLKHLKVDGGMTNGDLAMSILADIGGFTVVRPEMRECVLIILNENSTDIFINRSTALGSALLAGSAIRLFGLDISKSETLNEVNTKGSTEFKPQFEDAIREKKWQGWQRAVQKSMQWEEGIDT